MSYLRLICFAGAALLVVALFGLATGRTDLPEQPNNLGTAHLSAPFAKKPERIVSLAPANTEIIFALGAGSKVVGVTSYSDYPAEAKARESVGPYNDPDLEKIVELSPDIVFAAGEIQARHIKTLAKAGIRVVVVDPKSLEEILAAIDIVGAAIGEEEAAAVLHSKLRGTLDSVTRLASAASAKRVFIEVWDAPLLTVGSKSFVNDIVAKAGGINVAAGRNVDYTPCDVEALYAFNPDIYIVVSHGGAGGRTLVGRPELADLAAVKNNRVYFADEDILLRPGPRCFDGLVQLASIIQPEALLRGKE